MRVPGRFVRPGRCDGMLAGADQVPGQTGNGLSTVSRRSLLPSARSDVDSTISVYPAAVASAFGDQEAASVVLSLPELRIKQQGEVLEQFGPQHRPSSNAEVVRRRERYVVLIRDGNLEGVIDRVELASRIAAGEL
jgi:hypothetical protein